MVILSRDIMLSKYSRHPGFKIQERPLGWVSIKKNIFVSMNEGGVWSVVPKYSVYSGWTYVSVEYTS